MLPRDRATFARSWLSLLVTPLVFTALMLLATTAWAQLWNENGDAGDLPATAQSTQGTGALTQINGNLASPTDVDMYCIQVPNRLAFVACLQCAVTQGPHVWLFDAAGNGVETNTECSAGCKQINGFYLAGPGTYYLAVSYDAVYPHSGGGPIWNLAYTFQRPPDGPGAPGPVSLWSGPPNVQPINPYTIGLGGVTYCGSPTPTHADTWGRLKVLFR
jgi:hypothetical protein